MTGSTPAPSSSTGYTGSTDALVASKSYSVIQPGTYFSDESAPAKSVYNFEVLHGETKYYFQYGIGPLCIFCAAVFAIFWGTLAGLLVRKVNMEDYTSIEACILKYGKTAEQLAQIGGEKQKTSEEVMDTLKLVGTKITDGAKAFLYKEYIWLTIWSCSFAIVLGSTVDLLEMNVKRAPINWPYTATAYLTGSMTSILAGYIGMRIAVYTNTRVTFTCCTSVHRGFVTAFRGGQVLGFCLVGLGVLNIMIIILLFKACWYNYYLAQALDGGRPIDKCPAGSYEGTSGAQA